MNADHALSLAELRGRVVLLDFWTQCCINCLHELPMLHRLAERFGDALAVVGVHSAKFRNERALQSVEAAVQRLDVTHPVLNDPRRAVWSHYAVRAWPTFVLVDAWGYVVGALSGEGHEARLAEAIARHIAHAADAGVLAPRPTPVARAPHLPQSALSFPGKVLADEAHDRLYIADSHHHRVLVTTLDGRWVATIGGAPGFADGDALTAAFRNPQGLALAGDILYVCDTDNHAIRRVDLTTQRVETMWGTGRQAPVDAPGGVGVAAALNSPWDLAIAGETVFVAMAGSHQIWRGHLATGAIAPWAGSGAEGLHDGPLASAALAQPSGVALGPDGTVYVADSEVSGVRAIQNGRVTTLVGKNLFAYGDQDGPFDDAKLQHPLGVAWVDGAIVVADTYNHKIKRLDPAARTAATIAGDGETDALWEPGGLSATSEAIYIADTNHHRIRVLDRASNTLRTLALSGVPPIDMAR